MEHPATRVSSVNEILPAFVVHVSSLPHSETQNTPDNHTSSSEYQLWVHLEDRPPVCLAESSCPSHCPHHLCSACDCLACEGGFVEDHGKSAEILQCYDCSLAHLSTNMWMTYWVFPAAMSSAPGNNPSIYQEQNGQTHCDRLLKYNVGLPWKPTPVKHSTTRTHLKHNADPRRTGSVAPFSSSSESFTMMWIYTPPQL